MASSAQQSRSHHHRELPLHSPLSKMTIRSNSSNNTYSPSKKPSLSSMKKTVMAAGMPSSSMSTGSGSSGAPSLLLLQQPQQSRSMVNKHRLTTSMSSITGALGPADNSAITAGNRSTRVSPIKASSSSIKYAQHASTTGSSKTPAKSPHHHHQGKSSYLSKSVGHAAAAVANSSRNNAVVTAGGLGRMDVALKDWDGSRSTSNSPKKRPQSAKVRRCGCLTVSG